MEEEAYEETEEEAPKDEAEIQVDAASSLILLLSCSPVRAFSLSFLFSMDLE